MDKVLIIYLILVMLFVCCIMFFILSILKEVKFLKIESRIDDYTLSSIVDDTIPFFEKVYKNIFDLIKVISKVLENSTIFTKYSKHYQKYVQRYDKEKISSIDFISIKFLISFIIGVLYSISTIFNSGFNLSLLIIIMFLSFYLYDIYLNIIYKRRRKTIQEDLLSAIIIMNNAFKSGMNVIEAVDMVKEELNGPIKEEFNKISIDITYGLNIEEVFNRFYDRVKIEDVKYISTSLSLINKTGGNIVKVFNAIEKNFYDKKKIKDEMNSLTSSSKFMFKLLIIMPIILIILIYLLSPTYFEPLFTSFIGRIILLIIIILFTLYILVVKNIMKVNIDE